MKKSIRSALIAGLALGAVFAASEGFAQTLYKLIDKNGKVTYSESPPKDFDGKVVPMNIDPNANTATMPKAAPGAFTPPAGGSSAGGDAAKSARERLDAARKALKDAIDNPREGEVQRVGIVGGGTRPVETEEYKQRIAGLEADVRKAEEALRAADGR
jgi:hypothetical protein